jgi:hypothetical protein
MLEMTGDLRGAQTQAEWIRAAAPDRPYVSQFLVDPFLACLWSHFRVLWLTGFPDQSKAMVDEALARSEDAHTDPKSASSTLLTACVVMQLAGEATAVRELAEKGIEICRKYELALDFQWLLFYQGWATWAEAVDPNARAEGIGIMRGVMEFIAASGALFFVGTVYPCVFAQALIGEGNMEESALQVDQALSFAGATGHRFFEPELHRLKGEIHAAAGRMDEAESCFGASLNLARQQGARWLELRTAMSAARLWDRLGQRDRAKDLLSTVRGAFTEGFATPDLRNAARLLETLQS